jgi:hypothetical protein
MKRGRKMKRGRTRVEAYLARRYPQNPRGRKVAVTRRRVVITHVQRKVHETKKANEDTSTAAPLRQPTRIWSRAMPSRHSRLLHFHSLIHCLSHTQTCVTPAATFIPCCTAHIPLMLSLTSPPTTLAGELHVADYPARREMRT